MATAVQPEKILKDLAKLWVDLGKEDSQKGSAGVLRACAMTLIAVVEEESDAQTVAETIAELMHQHPSRVIVMRVSEDGRDALDARVFAQCWMPFGRRQQICCEEIEITASRSRVDDLPKLVLGIMAPDLPVVLWCRSENLCRDASFQQLFALTEKVILDSSAFGGPAGALSFIRGLIASGVNVGDLTWTRLTNLRETIAQIFENSRALPHLKDIRRIEISYAGPAPVNVETTPACLAYLMAWFRTSLGAPVEGIFSAKQDRYEVRGIRMEGPGFVMDVSVTGCAAEIDVNGLKRRVSFPRRADSDLLREELSILGVDPIYRRSIG